MKEETKFMINGSVNKEKLNGKTIHINFNNEPIRSET